MAESTIASSPTIGNGNLVENSFAPTGPVLKMVNGQPMVSSREVADHFGKRHADLIRSIAAIIRNAPESFNERNFALVEYVDPKGEKRPAYELTRDGFVIVAMGFTGPKAIKWKIAYVTAFNAMEAELSGKTPLDGPITPAMQQEIKELVQAKASAFPDADKPKVFSQMWMRLQRKFKIPRYSELPISQFSEARDYIINMSLRSVEAPALPASDSMELMDFVEAQGALIKAIGIIFGGMVRDKKVDRKYLTLCKGFYDLAYLTHSMMPARTA